MRLGRSRHVPTGVASRRRGDPRVYRLLARVYPTEVEQEESLTQGKTTGVRPAGVDHFPAHISGPRVVILDSRNP
jgi:hypothetical protein